MLDIRQRHCHMPHCNAAAAPEAMEQMLAVQWTLMGPMSLLRIPNFIIRLVLQFSQRGEKRDFLSKPQQDWSCHLIDEAKSVCLCLRCSRMHLKVVPQAEQVPLAALCTVIWSYLVSNLTLKFSDQGAQPIFHLLSHEASLRMRSTYTKSNMVCGPAFRVSQALNLGFTKARSSADHQEWHCVLCWSIRKVVGQQGVIAVRLGRDKPHLAVGQELSEGGQVVFSDMMTEAKAIRRHLQAFPHPQ